MKLHILTLSVLLLTGCGGGSNSSVTNSNANQAGNVQTIAAPKTNSNSNQEETVDETLLLTTVQNYIAESYSGWSLKGTERLEARYLNLHLLRGTDEKIVKISYKNFTELNGQSYLVVTKISENDLSKQPAEEEKLKANQNININTNSNR